MKTSVQQADVVIIGGGPAGSATALFLLQLGIRPIIIEKETFPRFHIGEGMTGECGAALRELGLEAGITSRKYVTKRGVNVYSQKGKSAFRIPVMSNSARGLQPSSTWHVVRSSFDKFMLDTALERGTTLVQGRAIAPLRCSDGWLNGISVRTLSKEIIRVLAKVVVDASGSATFLSSVDVAGKKERGNYTNQVAIFAHTKGADRAGVASDHTLIFYQKKHHWGWFIPIDDEIVSVGIVVPAAYFAACKESKRNFLLRECREMNPKLAARLQDATIIGEVKASSNYSYYIKQYTGKNWLCVGDSHRFIDPIFSFGLHFAVSEGKFAAGAISDYLSGKTTDCSQPFAAYQARTEAGQEVIQTMIDTFWEHSLAFGRMAHIDFVEEMINLFAGRIYHDEPPTSILTMREILAS